MGFCVLASNLHSAMQLEKLETATANIYDRLHLASLEFVSKISQLCTIFTHSWHWLREKLF